MTGISLHFGIKEKTEIKMIEEQINKDNNFITFNGKDYTEDQLNDKQKVIIKHIRDLQKKISSTEFSLDQLKISHGAFIKMLDDELKEKEDNDELPAQPEN
jgi:hypothetical protein